MLVAVGVVVAVDEGNSGIWGESAYLLQDFTEGLVVDVDVSCKDDPERRELDVQQCPRKVPKLAMHVAYEPDAPQIVASQLIKLSET